jgi:hypothetical protein
MSEATRVWEVLMVVTVTPSGKAPPGRLRSGVGAMALVTAFPVAARGSHADNSAGPLVSAGSVSAEPARPAPRSKGDAAWVDTWARLVTTKGRTAASRRRMPYGYHTTQIPEERLT